MQVQDTNQSASKVKSSFNHHKAMFTNNLSAALDLMILKKMNTEALSAYLQIHLFLKHSLDDKIMMNDKVCKIIKVLQKIIKKFIFLTKSSN